MLGVSLLILATFAGAASAEVAQNGPVRVFVDAQIRPTRLPRVGSAPVALNLSGHIAPTAHGTLSRLQRLDIAINSHGALRLGDLPL